MYKAVHSQGQQSPAKGVSKLLVGALLLGVGEFLGSGSAMLFGSDLSVILILVIIPCVFDSHCVTKYL